MKSKNKIRTFELLFLIIANMFIGFFIIITGTSILPQVAELSSEGSFVPFWYALSIFIGGPYFMYYKTFKLVIKSEKGDSK